VAAVPIASQTRIKKKKKDSEETPAPGFRLKFHKICIYRKLTLPTNTGCVGRQYCKTQTGYEVEMVP
jgi:hypothetical protein